MSDKKVKNLPQNVTPRHKSDNTSDVQLARCIDELRKFNNYRDRRSQRRVQLLIDRACMCGADEQFMEKLGTLLATSGFVELFQKMLQMHVNEALFRCVDTDLLWYNMASMKTVLRNVSRASTDLCDEIVQFNLHADVVRYLGSNCLKPALFNDERRKSFVRGLIGVLYNVIQRASNAIDALRRCNAAEVLQPLCDCKHKTVSNLALLTQSYLVMEEEIETIISRIVVRLDVDRVFEAVNNYERSIKNRIIPAEEDIKHCRCVRGNMLICILCVGETFTFTILKKCKSCFRTKRNNCT